MLKLCKLVRPNDSDNATRFQPSNYPLLRDIIDFLEERFPGFEDRLCDEKGELRNFVNVYVNGEDVRFLQGLETELKDGDEISVVPAVAGG